MYPSPRFELGHLDRTAEGGEVVRKKKKRENIEVEMKIL